MSPVQEVVTQGQLPLWVEYTKALGAPIVALVAACIAGRIAYQQMKTARNKLKLDLFDKRLKVFEACSELIREFYMPVPLEMKRLEEITTIVSGTRWLFSEDVAKYVDGLLRRGAEAMLRVLPNLDRMSHDEKINYLSSNLNRSKRPLLADMLELSKNFAPYLELEH